MVTDFNNLQPINVYSGIWVTELWIIADSSDSHSSNTLSPKKHTDDGILTDYKLTQAQNTDFPMYLTESGIFIDINESQS